MPKYKGLSRGRRRGEYLSTYLVAENVGVRSPPPSSKDFWLYQLQDYFERTGAVLSDIWEMRPTRTPWDGFVAHYAGSTILCKYYHKALQGGIVLEILSNDDIDDVKKKLTKKFSFLKESADGSEVKNIF